MAKDNKPTLKEALEDLDDSEWVYLGCKRGSAYMAIEQAADLRKNVGKVEKKYYNFHIHGLKGAIEKILSAPRTRRNVRSSLEAAQEKAAKARSEINTTTKEIKKAIEDCDNEKLSDLVDNLGDLYKDCESAVSDSARCEMTIDNLNTDLQKASASKDKILATLSTWVPFEQRHVSQQYRKKSNPHISEDGTVSAYGIVLLIEGDERGEYWTYDEVLNGVEAEEGGSDDTV